LDQLRKMKIIPLTLALAALFLTSQPTWADEQRTAAPQDSGSEPSANSYPPLDVLLKSGATAIGQPFTYPDGPAEVTIAIVTMQPGERTPWHLHNAPLFAHVLEGEITVDYGPDGKRQFSKGDTFVEAFKSRHQGHNSGSEIVRMLVIFAGAEGTDNTVLE